ncbi:MAG: hypothetical protein V1731_02660 [Candidatus Aenigmatarchaeota archaeon]
MRTIYAIGEIHPHELATMAMGEAGMPATAYQFDGDRYNNFVRQYLIMGFQIQNSGASPESMESARRKLIAAYKTLAKERQLLEEFRPDIFYVESSRKRPHILFDIAEKLGANVVHLDDGFQPYEDFISGKISKEKAQIGREEYWACEKIKETGNGQKGLLLAGRAHIFPNGVDSNVGQLPRMLANMGIELKILYDAEEILRNPTSC